MPNCWATLARLLANPGLLARFEAIEEIVELRLPEVATAGFEALLDDITVVSGAALAGTMPLGGTP
jgi:hypothetical protein